MERIKQLFSVALTFLSILLGVFTFSLMNALKWKGQAEGIPWHWLMLVTGFSLVASALIAGLCFYYHSKPMNLGVERLLIFLLYSVLIVCGLGTPIVGFLIYYAG